MKKKCTKKFISIFVAMLLIMAVAGCNGKTVATSEPESPSIVEVPPVVETPPTSEIASEPVSDPEPEVDPNEELTWQYLRIDDEEWFKDYEGLGVKRDGVLYALSNGVPKENWEKTGLGIRKGEHGLIFAKGDSESERILRDDKYVVPCVSGSDDVAWYGTVSSITIRPVDFYGYTVPIQKDKEDTSLWVYDNGKKEFDSYDDLVSVSNYQKKVVELVDVNGNNVFDDFRNLNSGELYTLKWTDNGEAHEESLIACWRYYKGDASKAIILEGTPTDDPKVFKYDFSNVPSGLYELVEGYSIIEVKND